MKKIVKMTGDFFRRRAKRTHAGFKFHPIYYWVEVFLSVFIFSRMKNKHIVTPLPIQRKKYICVFSHFDKDNLVDDYVLYYIKNLFESDCNVIFVTTSIISHHEQEKLFPYCDKIIIRENIGYDFSSYKIGIESVDDINQYEKLIIANDSCYGPLYPLKEILSYGDEMRLDMWGVATSREFFYHIQSYFLVFNQAMFKSPSFKNFWKSVHIVTLRENIVFKYEIGASQYFLKKGFKLGAFCDCDDIKTYLLSNNMIAPRETISRVLPDYSNRPIFNKLDELNISLYCWDIIIANYRCPFIKRDLLYYNLCKVDISYWQALLGECTQFDVSLIENHLKRF